MLVNNTHHIDFMAISNAVNTVGLHAHRDGARHAFGCGRADVEIAYLGAGRGYRLRLNTGHAERDEAVQMVADLEAALESYGIQYEALGQSYEGGSQLHEYEVEINDATTCDTLPA